MTSGDQTLRFRPIAVAVVHTARRHAWPILVVSIVVSAVTVAVDAAADHLLDQADVTTAVVGALSTSTVSLLGAVFLSGFLGRLVSTTEHGASEHGNAEHGTEHGEDRAGGGRQPDPRRAPVAALGLADPGRPAGRPDRPGRAGGADHSGADRPHPAVRGRTGHRARAPPRPGRPAPIRASGPAALLAGRGPRDPAAAGGQRGGRHPAGSVRDHQRRDHRGRAVDRRRHRRIGGRPAAGGTVLPADRRRSRRRSAAADPDARPAGLPERGRRGRPRLVVASGEGLAGRRPPGTSAARVAAKRLPRAWRATRSASSAVSTSSSSGTWRTRRPASRSRSSWTRPV